MKLTPIEMIAKLVSFDTTSNRSNLSMIEFVQKYLDSLGIESQIFPNEAGNKASLCATIGPITKGGVMLSGHSDVVPVSGQSWDSDPFSIKQRAERLYGRGTADMKSFIAIALALVPEMIRSDLKCPIHILISFDEETTCQGVVPMLDRLKQFLPPARAVIVGEPTNMQIVNMHKGSSGYIAHITGLEAHSSLINNGVSAISLAAKMVNYIDEKGVKLSTQTQASSLFDPAGTTMHVGTITGGTASNIIARECQFNWEIRNIPEHDPNDIFIDIERFGRQLIQPYKSKSPQIGITFQSPYPNVPALNAEQNSVAEHLCAHLSGKNATSTASYTSEAGIFQQRGYSTVLCGPGSIEQAHIANEYIELSQLNECQTFLKNLIVELSN